MEAMPLIRTTADLLKALKENPEWREAVRVQILGEELLSLPDLVRENSRQIAENSRQIAENSRQIAENSRQIAALTGEVKDLRDDMGYMKGRDLERDIETHPRAYVRKRHMVAIRSVLDDERYDLSSVLEASEGAELDLLDVILEGELLDGRHGYVAIEASVTLERRDIERALGRAKLLAKAANAAVLPLVVCTRSPQDRLVEYARRQHVAISQKQRGIFLEAPLVTSDSV